MTLKNLVAFLLLLGVCVGCALAWDKLKNGSTVKTRRRLKHGLSRWGGLAITIAGIYLWFALPAITNAVAEWAQAHLANMPAAGDDASGSAFMDVGVFQTLPLAGIRSVALFCYAILMLRVYQPVVYRFWKKNFTRAFYRLSEWQKIIVSLWCVSLFVFICVSLTH
jgi:hypothetical protein